MKRKTIKSIIKNKINDWLDSIEDEDTRKAIEKNIIVTGGAIASMFLKEKVNDYDVYFRTKEAAIAATDYYIKRFKENPPTKLKGGSVQDISWKDCGDRIKIMVQSAGVASEDGADNYEYFENLQDAQEIEAMDYVEKVVERSEEGEIEKPKYRPTFLSSNAITLSNKIQLVIRFIGEPDEIHKNYDFVHCTNYWESKNGHLVTNGAALECLLSKELRYVGSKYPLCSIIRTRKFIARGWTINAGQYLKMAMQLNELDLNSVSVLEEQLIGVDVHYFYDILSRLKEKDKDRVDSNYLMEIVDRVF